MSIKNIIFFVLSMYVIYKAYLDISNFESFQNDLSLNFMNSNKIIYDINPYANSTLFYNYMSGAPYGYNPLDYWLNPYVYYSWYTYPSFGTSANTSYTNPIHRPHRYNNHRYHNHRRHRRHRR
jgi:hypothetical protein